MNMTINFGGYLENIVEEAIRRGIVKTKTEALRAGLLELANKYKLGTRDEEMEEEKEILAEVRKIEEGIRAGKVKTYSKKEFEKLVGLD